MAESSETSVDPIDCARKANQGSSEVEHTSSTVDPTPLSQDPNCVFCRISRKDAPAEIVYEDTDFVVFVDRKPASTHHYLVIPRNHIPDPRSLTGEHVALVERMAELGKQVLTERGGRVEEARMGFHWPPFILVRHLHLHVIGPESSMGWLGRNLIFRKDSFAFSSHTWMIEHLKNIASRV